MGDISNKDPLTRRLYTLALVNAGIWALSLIALIFVISRDPGAKGMFPILGGGAAVATALVSTIHRRGS